MSGQECSSTKADFICAARVPGGVNCRGNVHGHRIRNRLHDKVFCALRTRALCINLKKIGKLMKSRSLLGDVLYHRASKYAKRETL